MVDSAILHLNNFINTWKGWGDVAAGVGGVFKAAEIFFNQFKLVSWLFAPETTVWLSGKVLV